jgi:hypothetical protein
MKPLLFLLEKESGTLGDQKPFSILAIIAASVSPFPVTLYCNGFNSKPPFMSAIKRFAQFVMGPNASHHFKIEYGVKNRDELWTHLSQNYCIIDNYDFDFGASVERAKNRFKTKLFPYRAKILENGDWTMVPANTRHFFGPVLLPMVDGSPFWSKPKIVNKLIQFKDQHKYRKIITIAGSLRPPFPMNEISEWLDNNKNQKLWAFIILDVYNSNYFDDPNVLLLDYVEFEDLVRFSDVFIGNCGAGSTMTAMSEAMVQTCRISNSVGADKPFNQQVITNLGPIESSFHDFMVNLRENFNYFEVNAIKVKYIIREEVKQMIRNMHEFFGKLATDARLQEQFTKTRLIPTIYALE